MVAWVLMIFGIGFWTLWFTGVTQPGNDALVWLGALSMVSAFVIGAMTWAMRKKEKAEGKHSTRSPRGHETDDGRFYPGMAPGPWGWVYPRGTRQFGKPPRATSDTLGVDHSGRGPRSYRRSDARIEEDVNGCLTQDWAVDATDVEISVTQGVVTLKGLVENSVMMRIAEEIAQSVYGVTKVRNELKVKDAKRFPQRRVA